MAKNETNLVLGLRARNAQLEKDLAKAKGSLKRFQKQSKTISMGINKSMVSMFGVFTAGVVARDIFNTVSGFEKQMDKLQAISGSTDRQMQKLSKSAIEIGRASKFTALEIGKLKEELARLGFTTNQIIASTDAIRKLATAADAELGESAKILASTLNAFNLEAKESNEVANIMAESFSKSALDLNKFGVAMANVGATAQAAGFSLGQTTAMLGVLVDSGIDASKAGTDLRKIFTELSLQNITLEEAFNKIRLSTDKVKTAFDLFGQRAQTSAIILAENSAKLGELQGELGDSNKELNTMVGIMEDNLITDLEKLKSAWDGWILSLEDGSGVGSSVLRGIAKSFTDLLNGLSDWESFTKGSGVSFGSLSKNFKQVQKEVDRIKLGETFNNVAVDTMGYTEAIATLDKRLAAFKQHKHYEEIAEAIAEYKEELKQANIETQKSIAIENNKKKTFDTRLEELKALEPNLQSRDGLAPADIQLRPLGLNDADELFRRQREEIQEKYADFSAFMVSQNEMLTATIRDSMAAGISGFAEGLATGGLEDALNNIAVVFANGISQIGDQLISYGVTMLAAKRSLENPFKNPGVAIAAGIAAKLAASALKKAISSSSSGIASGLGGGSGGGSGGPSGRFAGDIQGQAVLNLPSEIKLVAKGGDLYGVMEIQRKKNFRNRAA